MSETVDPDPSVPRSSDQGTETPYNDLSVPKSSDDGTDDPIDPLLAAVARIAPKSIEPEWTPPAELDEYRLIRPIGRGGMGSVWLAEDRLLGRLVAVKFIAGEPDEHTRERFAIEARAAARLQHTNVVTVHRYGELAGRPYLVSEYIRGESLDKLAKPVSWERSLELGIALARGLAAAHRHGIVHRDIKPANAIVTPDGEAKLVDFGLAKLDGTQRTSEPKIDQVPLGLGSNLTEHGRVAGTPRYLAPEVRRGDPASRRSDVYQIGCILYELVTARAPLLDMLDRQAATTSSELVPSRNELETPPLGDRVGAAGARFAAVVDRCLKADPQARYASGDELREALEQIQSPIASGTVPEGNPYRGLVAFEAEHRSLFFGRGADVRAVVERLRGEAFVLVTGDSGVGKSSLCRASVLPLIAESGDVVVRMVPGTRPLATLASSLAGELALDETELASVLRDTPAAVPRELRRALAGRGLVVFVDQLEELATITDREQAEAFARVCAELASGTPRIRLLATVRSDFLTRVAELPGIGSEISRAIYLLRPLTAEGAREAIVGPASATGVRFESDDLVDTLVGSSSSAGTVELPLLAFTLAQLWEARDQRTATISARSLEAIGGVRGALARHADGVLERLVPGQRVAARKLLLRLVTADRTRARRTANELASFDREALDALVRGRLVVVRGTDEPTYELAHERLIDGWPTLAGWLAENTEAIVVHARLSAVVAEWERVERSKDALCGARMLDEVALVGTDDLTSGETEFLRRSRNAVWRARWIRRGVIAAIPLGLLSLYVGAKLVAQRKLDGNIADQVARAQPHLAQARATRETGSRLRAEAFEKFDTGAVELGERAWQKFLASSVETRAAFEQAAKLLEGAFLLDTARDDLRSELASVTYERLQLADNQYRSAERDELAGRLELYDPALAAGLAVPARLVTEIEPATTSIDLVGPDGSIIPARGELAPGSYVVHARADGHATVRVPIVLRAGAHARVSFTLPRAGAVPPGFIYIPEGEFLFGSREPEVIRTFMVAVPMHAVRTRAFLIGRTEVTYAQWIEFLDALEPDERKRRAPRIETSASVDEGNEVELRQLPDGTYELMFSPGRVRYRARQGSPIEYRDRTIRKLQDWQTMPVSGISAEDAIAYAAWLDRSGRVKRARLCTEQEWERGARGADGRSYPHGGEDLSPDDANIDSTYGHKDGGFGPDEVGSHPASTSPHGLVDTSGNLWEITRTFGETFVIRGGVFYNGAKVSHLANRELITGTFRHLLVGVRICADP